MEGKRPALKKSRIREYVDSTKGTAAIVCHFCCCCWARRVIEDRPEEPVGTISAAGNDQGSYSSYFQVQSSLSKTVDPSSHSMEAKDTRSTKLNTSREILGQRAHMLVEEINAKRKQDTQLMADYKKTLDVHVQQVCSSIEDNMFQLFDRQSQQVQTKLQELFCTLDSIAQLETELTQFKRALGILYEQVHTE